MNILSKHPKIESASIITVQEFVDALNLLVAEDGLTEAHIQMLTAQCRTRGTTITATALAKAAGYKIYSAANLQYGMLAHKIADKLGYTPPNCPNGKPMYWTTLSIAGTEESEQFEFVMRREIVKALKITGIVKPLQNRVLPTGEIVASSALCDMMGNRGTKRLHNRDRKLVTQYSSNIDWKSCTLSATDKAGNNIQRELMGNSYTELFFLDEATAYANGNRPCSSCRMSAFKLFIKIWIKANSEHYELKNDYISEIDEKLSGERIDVTGNKVTYEADPAKLPNGTMMEKDGKCFLKFEDKLLEWSQAGYVDAFPAARFGIVNVLTPKSIVRCFDNGLPYGVHKSAYDFV
jgi:hypothetical protein